MALSGQQRKKLQDALIDAFPTIASLEQMLSYQLDKNLRAIAGEGSLEEIVFRLIQRAKAEGWVEKLILSAQNERPGNKAVEAISQELLSDQTTPSSYEDKVTQQPKIMVYDLSIIRQLIEQALTAENLNDLCFDYFRSVYDNFTDGQSVSYRRRQLLEYADKHREVPKLLKGIQQYNLTIYQEFVPKLGNHLE